MSRLEGLRRTLAGHVTAPIIRGLSRLPLTPNMLTWCGLLLVIVTAVLIGCGHLIAAGIMVLFSGAFDMLDGALARATNRITRYGAVLDASIDRLGEAALLIGVTVLFLSSDGAASYFSVIGREWSLLITALALASFSLPSYIRARMEAAGGDCRTGIFTRPERVILLALGLLLNQIAPALALCAALSLITAAQRLMHARKHLKD